ncbi:hypothetical protein Tdes44962_MAKER04403 [Teratosphaeria destructans]|uniref:Uncharacterized protein n=1 Tax=Teratosphaeria destructans TaxID=418781 RepID=A0A9W7SMM5_9PEZI|nr:hypothetical protein Tdes44962_MAKER04403 [Teratosphaeria destructans]
MPRSRPQTYCSFSTSPASIYGLKPASRITYTTAAANPPKPMRSEDREHDFRRRHLQPALSRDGARHEVVPSRPHARDEPEDEHPGDDALVREAAVPRHQDRAESAEDDEQHDLSVDPVATHSVAEDAEEDLAGDHAEVERAFDQVGFDGRDMAVVVLVVERPEDLHDEADGDCEVLVGVRGLGLEQSSCC